MAFLFAATLFLGAFLLFSIEPLAARVVLPTLGGAPMVWNTCVVFFQGLLLAGYAFAHALTSSLPVRRQTILYLVLLGLAIAGLPFATHLAQGPSPQANPIPWLLTALAGLIGLPFFALSASASILQTWFARSGLPGARNPYFLYAASNAGSLLALVAYPALLEPTLRLRDQSRVWAAGYVVFVIAVCACAYVRGRQGGNDHASEAPAAPALEDGSAPSIARRARWVILALIPSSLMLAVTSYVSTDIASIPLLWIVPLGIYLLTFIVAFGTRSAQVTAFADRALPLLLLPLALFMMLQATVALWFVVPLHLLTFAMISMVCHGQLAADSPPPARLSEFYLWLALGGVLGGLLVTLLAPLLFRTVIEYPLMLILACLVRRGRPGPSMQPDRGVAVWLVPLAIGALTACLILLVRTWLDHIPRVLMVSSLPLFACFSQSRRPLRFALSVAAMWIAAALAIGSREGALQTERTFFGVYRVAIDQPAQYRRLVHGTTLHGLQAVAPERQGEPLSYYHRTGPFGQAFAQLPHVSPRAHVAVVGLGVGSLASYASAEQDWTFYELDPAVERLARTASYFTFMSQCGDRCRVVIGDARLSLAEAPANQYTLIVLDAFSSDAIPVHLLTSEALTLYRSRLAPGGVLAFHISNRHLSLSPPLAQLAAHHGLVAFRGFEKEADAAKVPGKSPSDWVMMAAGEQDLGGLPGDPRWQRLTPTASQRLWTDDYSSVLGVLRLR